MFKTNIFLVFEVDIVQGWTQESEKEGFVVKCMLSMQRNFCLTTPRLCAKHAYFDVHTFVTMDHLH